MKSVYPNDDIFVIDYRSLRIENDYRAVFFRKTIFQNVSQFLYAPKNILKRQKFNTFRKTYLNLGSADFSSYDVIYYGSDQIWNTALTGGDLAYFGKGFSGKKIAYAASDGGELELTGEVISLLNGFSEISCRENALAERLRKENVSTPIRTESDPVFLLSKEAWLRIAEKPKESGYILAYKISDRADFDRQAELLSEKLGKPVIQIVYVKSIKKLFYKRQKFVQGVSPAQFLGYIANADYVLTTSFHGTAFSILFEKPFTVLSFDKRSERVREMLERYGMEECFKAGIKYDGK